jgi:hypothetical protein
LLIDIIGIYSSLLRPKFSFNLAKVLSTEIKKPLDYQAGSDNLKVSLTLINTKAVRPGSLQHVDLTWVSHSYSLLELMLFYQDADFLSIHGTLHSIVMLPDPADSDNAY